MRNTITITKKELRTYFNHPTAYILMVVFLAISYFFYFRPVLITGETTLRPLFDIMPWILMFFVPAVTMSLVAKEKNDGTIETLTVQPIKLSQIIFGKALGAFLFTFITVLITLTIPITLERFGSYDWGLIVSQYIGSMFLIAGLVAIGVWASSITKNQIISFISSIAINFFLIFTGFEMVTLSLPYPLNIIFKKLSIMGHFYNIARGVIDLKDIIYFIGLIIIFIFLSYLSLLNIRGGKGKERKKLDTTIIIIIIAAFIVNLSGDYIKGRLDLTSGQIFTLSKATKDVIKNLNDDLTIDLFVSQKLPAQIETQAQDVKDLLEDYTTRSNGKIKLNIYHPDTNNEDKAKAENAGIPAIQFNVIAKDEFQVKQGYLGLTVAKNPNEANTAGNQDSQESIQFIENTDNLEYQLTSFILKLTKKETKNIAWLTGHGEKGLYQDFSAVNQELAKQYQVETLDLKEPIDEKSKKKEVTYKDVPSETALLVIAGPTENISEAELGKINYYLSNGGSMLVMDKEIDVNTQYMSATSTENNLNLMLNEWGVKVDKSLVYDLKSNESVSLRQGVMNYILPYPFWVRGLITSDNKIFPDIKSIVLPWTSPIKIVDEKLKENTKITGLYGTTDAAGEQTEYFSINPQSNFSKDNLSAKLLAVAVENSFNEKLSRIVVVGNVDFASDQFLSNSPENGAFLLNSIEWLSQDSILSSIRAKNLSRAPLVFKSEADKNSVKYFNTIGVPVIIILIGAYILQRRKKISKQIYEG